MDLSPEKKKRQTNKRSKYKQRQHESDKEGTKTAPPYCCRYFALFYSPVTILADGSIRSVIAPCPKKEGWLMKQGGLVKNWNLRWFVFEDYKLTYYTVSNA